MEQSDAWKRTRRHAQVFSGAETGPSFGVVSDAWTFVIADLSGVHGNG